MKITHDSTDSETMQEIGKRLQRYRIDSGLSQSELSNITGISAKTIANLEYGKQTNTLTIIRILRALGLLDNLDLLVPPQDNRPTDFLRYNKKAPQRAKRNRNVEPERTWKWGDEK